jgi:FMN phosphatase YigB (HAD superfamily)
LNLTLLIDLDDTLLQNDIDRFLPHYLGAFSKEVAPITDPERFVKSLLAGTQAMVKNRRPDLTLQEAFEQVFFPATGLNREVFLPVAEHFYADVFPKLRSLTQPKPGAAELIQAAEQRGYRLAVTTNPLFPRTAILQRLEWAGLPADQHPFDLIASYETFHFCKPEPAFFAEALARLGWPDGAVLVIGDSQENEVNAACSMGLAVFWISQAGVNPTDGGFQPSASGDIKDVLDWIERTPLEALQPDFSSPAAMRSILRATPAALDSLCRTLPESVWNIRPAPDEWSLTEILCHLRDVETQVNLERIRKVLAEDNPLLTGQDTDRWADERRYILQDGRQALQEFTRARMENLDMLARLQPSDWQRPARHTILGPTQLAEIVNIAAAHDRLHIQQAHRALFQPQHD